MRLILGLLAAPFCYAQWSGLVISQVYLNANTNPSSYAVIFNSGPQTLSLSGLSLQTLNGANVWLSAMLSGTLSPGQSYLVALSGSNLELSPDATVVSPPGNDVVAVALVQATTPTSTLWPAASSLVDLVGTIVYAGQPISYWPISSAALLRKNNGCQNTGNNLVDFLARPPL